MRWPVFLLAISGSLATWGCAQVRTGSPPSPELRWRPIQARLSSPWARDVDPRNPWPQYPRPLLRRPDWKSLNGLWDYTIQPKTPSLPTRWQGKILVPYPVESSLSGVGRTLHPGERLWYRCFFRVPPAWRGRRLRLNFGAVDWSTRVWLNGHLLGEHRGGYDGFSFLLDEALRGPNGAEQELLLAIEDPTDQGAQPRGKQVLEAKGIWYHAVGGIWQTVWLEPLPEASITTVAVRDYRLSEGDCRLEVGVESAWAGDRVEVRVRGPEGEAILGRAPVEGVPGPRGMASISLHFPAPHLWSPEDPWLYPLEVRLQRGARTVDRVQSELALRKIQIQSSVHGPVLALNGRPRFLLGVLDQGWWPAGLYTAPSEEAMRSELRWVKDAGFDLIRKHVKVEPDRWYWICDHLGLLVWQDMPSGSGFAPAAPERDLEFPRSVAEGFRGELAALLAGRGAHPSIIAWTLFNEGWGQHDTAGLSDFVSESDPSRLLDQASGWSDHGGGQVLDRHRYPGPGGPWRDESGRKDRIRVLGEFGGLGWPVPGHQWSPKRSWSYRDLGGREELALGLELLWRRLRPSIESGLSVAIYTQLTDVEGESNGLWSYDRAVAKVSAARLAALRRLLDRPLPPLGVILPTAETQAPEWRFRTSTPRGDWMVPTAEDADWATGAAGFGSPGIPGTVLRTPWSTPDLWLRRSFDLKRLPERPVLRIHHGGDAVVWLNGVRIAELHGDPRDYEELPLGEIARAAFRPGRNLLAVHVHRTTAGQFFDAGFLDLGPDPTGNP